MSKGNKQSRLSRHLAEFRAKLAALFVSRSSSLSDTKKLADAKEVFDNLPKPKASVPSSLGMVRKW